MVEDYTSTKFSTEFKAKNAPSDKRLEELKRWCKAFHEKDLTPPNDAGCASGNLSFRTEEGFIITGTGLISKGEITDDCFVEVISVDFQTGKVSARGTREPSSEDMLHHAIYLARPDVNAIFHGHCKEILNNAGKLKLPITEREEPYGSVALVQSVIDVLEYNSYLIMRNHGFISLGKSMKEAGEKALEILKKCDEQYAPDRKAA